MKMILFLEFLILVFLYSCFNYIPHTPGCNHFNDSTKVYLDASVVPNVNLSAGYAPLRNVGINGYLKSGLDGYIFNTVYYTYLHDLGAYNLEVAGDIDCFGKIGTRLLFDSSIGAGKGFRRLKFQKYHHNFTSYYLQFSITNKSPAVWVSFSNRIVYSNNELAKYNYDVQYFYRKFNLYYLETGVSTVYPLFKRNKKLLVNASFQVNIRLSPEDENWQSLENDFFNNRMIPSYYLRCSLGLTYLFVRKKE